MARLNMQEFLKRFNQEVSRRKMTWEVKGFYGADGRVYPFGTDTKVLSTVFESLCAPLILDIAEACNYDVSFAKQTVYPDFTLTPSGASSGRIAVDIKTTYQARGRGDIKFTLGSYTSFLRDGKKNIAFPYTQYDAHWVIGFVYRRCESIPAKVYGLIDNPAKIMCPYCDVRYFVQEKHKIAGKTPGSGNTANIGSFPTKDIGDLAAGKGPFAALGVKAFEEYWKSYGKR